MSGRKRLYPPGWRELSLYIRYGRANGQCECEGECGLHRTHPGPRRCEERDGQPAKWAKGRVVLTVAHLNAAGDLCQCAPLCGNERHLKAMCQRCHNRYDIGLRARNRSHTNAVKLAAGTPTLFEEGLA